MLSLQKINSTSMSSNYESLKKFTDEYLEKKGFVEASKEAMRWAKTQPKLRDEIACEISEAKTVEEKGIPVKHALGRYLIHLWKEQKREPLPKK